MSERERLSHGTLTVWNGHACGNKGRIFFCCHTFFTLLTFCYRTRPAVVLMWWYVLTHKTFQSSAWTWQHHQLSMMMSMMNFVIVVNTFDYSGMMERALRKWRNCCCRHVFCKSKKFSQKKYKNLVEICYGDKE